MDDIPPSPKKGPTIVWWFTGYLAVAVVLLAIAVDQYIPFL